VDKVLEFVLNLLERASSRSFVVSVVVIYWVATHPELTIEQLVGLLGAVGFVTLRAVGEDRVEITRTPQGDAE
jgi:hypothetical protein